MEGGFGVVSAVGGGATIISGAVAVYAWRHRTERVAMYFIGLMAALALWSGLYSIQLGFGISDMHLLLQRISLGVAGFVPVMWLLFVLSYIGASNWLTLKRIGLLLLEPVVFLGLSLTNPSHKLIWTEATWTSTWVGYLPVLDFGVGYVIHVAFAYTVVTTGIVMLLVYGGKVAPTYQRQVLVLVIAAIPPFFAHILYTFGASPITALDLTPFLFAFTGVIFGLGLFQYELLHLAPMAQDQSFEEIGDGLVVVNTSGKIVDLSGVAASVLDPTPRIGDPITAIFPDRTLDKLDRTELQSPNDRGNVYQLQVSDLTDHRERRVGQLLILRDITAFWESNQRLSVSNRVLRHNLRNGMTVIVGVAEQLETRLTDEDAADARHIRTTAEQLVDIAEKSRQITELSGSETGSTTIDAASRLREVIDELHEEYPTAEFHSAIPPVHSIAINDAESFDIVVWNVIDNAIRHNDGPRPRIEITLDRTDEATRIVVSDNGPGIPEIEQQAIGADVETPLTHSQGVGLWLTYWCVRQWSGGLDIETSNDGTSVSITIPHHQSVTD